MGDDHPCNVEGKGTVRIKMFDEIIRELKEVRYVPQHKRNLISVGTSKILGLVVFIRDGVLKMAKGTMVVMKSVRRNNFYYMKGSTVIGEVETFISSDDVCTHVWHMRLEHEGENSLQASAKKGSLEGASTCNMKLGEHGVLDKKTKMKFSTTIHHSEGLLDCVHVSIWGPAKTASLGGHGHFVCPEALHSSFDDD